jgi:hypothetical protein
MIHSESKTSNKSAGREISAKDKATSIIAEAGAVGVPLEIGLDSWLSVIQNICNQLCDEMILETRSAYWYEVKREVNKYIDAKRKSV